MPSGSTTDIEQLLVRIAADYPDLQFIESNQFAWHAGKKRVAYRKSGKNPSHSMFSLLHELGHAVLEHKNYTHDIELVQLEVAAWQKARELGERYGITLDNDHVQDCLDTYRDWLHLRATCPACFGRSLQASERLYRCFNCQTEWQVSRSRLCRPYRLTKSLLQPTA